MKVEIIFMKLRYLFYIFLLILYFKPITNAVFHLQKVNG